MTCGLGRFFSVVLFSTCFLASAEERYWSGYGADGEWQNRTNWSAWFVPVPGDSLWFTDALAPRRAATNDFPAGTTFSNLTVGSSYKLYGNGVLLQGELRPLANGGTAEIHLPVAFDRDAIIECSAHFAIVSYASLSNLGHRIAFSGMGTQIVNTIAAASEVRLGFGFPPVLRLTNASFYTGQTIVDAGELSMEHNNALGVAAQGSGTIINPSGRLRLRPGLDTYEPLAIAGQILFPGSATFVAAVNWRGEVEVFGEALLDMPFSDLVLHAPVHGAGKLIVDAGTLVLNATNSFGGVQLNTGGELRLMGYQPDTPVLLNGGLLAGSGTVGEILTMGTNISTIRLGSFPYNVRVGTLTTSNLVLSSKVRYEVELTANAADKLVVHGGVDLNDAVLALALSDLPPSGIQYVIIDNEGSDPVSGQFEGMPQGKLMEMANGARVTIDYAAGDGNDVVLTVDHFAIKWAGGFTSGNNLWTTRQNWFYGLLPSAGDELQFGYTQYSKTNINDLPPYQLFRALVFAGANSTGWRLEGSPVVLSHGIFDASPSGTNVLALGILGAGSLTISNSTGTLLISGDISNHYGSIEFHTDGMLIVSGTISSSGRVQKTGSGTLVFHPMGQFPRSRIVQTRFANGELSLTGWGLPGVTYAIEASDDLKVWGRIGQSICADSGEYIFTDSASGTLQKRFYRVRSP